MRTLKAEHFFGASVVHTKNEVRRLLANRRTGGFDEIWLTGPTNFPNLVVAIGPPGAALHYFPEDGHPGWQSVGTPDAPGSVEFRTNTPEEKNEIAASAVVSTDMAARAMEQFLEDASLPDCVSWHEL